MLLPRHIRRPNELGYALTAVAIVVLGIASSAYVYMSVDQAGRAHIQDRAQTLAVAIPYEQVTQLHGDVRDEGTPAYDSLKSLLTRIRVANRDVRFAYLIGKDANNTLFFYADSEPTTSSEYSPPGQAYPEATEPMRQVFVERLVATEGPSRDRWGVWISAYAPVVDGAGRVVALAGLDLPATEFLLNSVLYASLPLLIALVLLVLISAAERMHAREYRAIGQKAEFLSIASHEIRTPLTGIRWAVESLLKDKTITLDARATSMLERVHDSCIMLVARINNLLDVTAFESQGRAVLQKSPIQLKSFLEEIAESLALSARERDITIDIDASFDDAPALVADPQTMHHVFFNLIANGVKYTQEHTTVRVSYRAEPKWHVITVRDDGPGMSPEDMQHIFEGYHRTEEAVRSGQYGSGLGLYLVRQAAEMHGGSIRVDSAKGMGAVFTLRMPRV